MDYLKNQTLEIKVALQILKPTRDVFEAIVDPKKMSSYFISKSSGKMEEGKRIIWRFPEFDMDFPIRVGKIELNKYISYYWEVDGKELLVEMTLTPRDSDSTLVTITEKGRENDEAGVKWLMGNTEGWANFLACLKAYLEYGINLRKGAFDFLKS
ncbi:MAG: SRPBCC family protein [Candidatus Bathyarchaeia archaeon]